MTVKLHTCEPGTRFRLPHVEGYTYTFKKLDGMYAQVLSEDNEEGLLVAWAEVVVLDE